MNFVMNYQGEIFNKAPCVYDDKDESYNCGGYALGIDEWYHPYVTPQKADYYYDAAEDNFDSDFEPENDEEKEEYTVAREYYEYWQEHYDEVVDGFHKFFFDCFGHEMTDDEERELGKWSSDNCVILSVFIMLSVFPWLRKIESMDELNNDEYGIIFAVGHHDFHFVRYDNGIYTHKMGPCPIEEVDDWRKAFYCDWFSDEEMRYDKGHVFFAAKKPEYR